MSSMEPSGSSSKRRKHTTTACGPCRESKVKCDGSTPTCASCVTRGKQCYFEASDDKRKLSHRLVVELLCHRVEELGRFIRQHSQEPPAMDAEKYSLLTRALGHLRLLDAVPSKDSIMHPGASQPLTPSNPVCNAPENASYRSEARGQAQPDSNDFGIDDPQPIAVGSEMELPGDMNSMHNTNGSKTVQLGADGPGPLVNVPTENLFVDWPWSSEDLSLLPTHPLSNDSFNIPDPSSLLDPVLEDAVSYNDSDGPQSKQIDHADAEETEALISQLADRVGSLRVGAGGQVLYDGATSNFNLVDMGAPDNLTVHRTVRQDGPTYLKRLDMGKKVPQDLEDHLSNLYFTWQDPAFHVVKRETFEKAKVSWREHQQDTPYFSEALQNAICSLGAAFEPRHFPTFISFPKSLADFFADRAKTLLEIELDSPCVATVQTLVILSGHDIGCKRDSRGWLYSGMATRLAFHLALHLDMSGYVFSQAISQEEADLRRDVFWAAYTVDHIWSSHLGRAFRINMECVTVSKPIAEQTVNPTGSWSPYISTRSPPAQNPLPDPTVELHRQRVLLCEIMAPLGFALYGNLNMAPSGLHELNKLTVSKLQVWRGSLPPSLHVKIDDFETKYLPHVLLLQMSFHQNIIYCHRPWMSRGGNTSQAHLNVGHDPEHARSMCMEAAVSISKLLQMYEALYGLRRINIQAVGMTCSAALLLIFAIIINSREENEETTAENNDNGSSSSNGTPSQRAAAYLGVCFNALDELGFAWESAKKSRHFLHLLQKRWETQVRKIRKGEASMREKRARSEADDLEPRTQIPNFGLHFGQESMHDMMDWNGDIGWILMDSDNSPGGGFRMQGADQS